MYTYTISDENVVEIFAEGQESPILRQPQYPNGDAFDTNKEASEWATLYIASIEDGAAPYAPMAKGTDGAAKETDQDKLARLKAMSEKFGASTPASMSRKIARLESKLA